MESKVFRLLPVAASKMLLLVLVVMMSSGETSAYGKSRYYSRPGYGRSFLNKNSYKSYYTPKSRFTHYGQIATHPHPHPHQEAIGVPVPITLNGNNFINDVDAVSRFMPYGYQDSYLIPLESLLTQLAGQTGYKTNQLPQMIRNIKHEFYVGAHKADPLLHAILKRYGFVYTGTGLGYGQMGATVPQNEVNDIFQSLGLGGQTNGNGYAPAGLGPSTGVSSAQTPLPGSTGITDDLFDNFDNSLLGMMAEGTAGTARLNDQPQPMIDDSEAQQTNEVPATGNDNATTGL